MRYGGKEVDDMSLSQQLQEGHACRIIGFLSEDTPRMAKTTTTAARRRRRGREDYVAKDEGGPRKRARQLSNIVEQEEGLEMFDDAPSNPFAQASKPL